MKNIAVLSILVIMLFPLFCEEQVRNYGFSLGTQFGFVNGQALEYVYPTDTKGEFLSELRYDMKSVFYLGLTADFGRTDIMSAPGFFTSLSFKYGIPGDSGSQENRDWVDKETNHLTHFSSHTNKTRSFYWMDIAIGASIPVKSWFYIKPFLSGSWMHFAFTGRDGYGRYARCITHDKGGCEYCNRFHPIEINPLIQPFKGDVIHYQQDWLILATGFSFGTKILSPFTFEFTFQISPFTYCAAIDEHIERNTTFRDYSAWGLFLEPKGRISYAIKRFDLSLEFAYRHIGKTKGPAYQDDGNTGSYVRAGEAGAGLSLMDVSFLAGYRF